MLLYMYKKEQDNMYTRQTITATVKTSKYNSNYKTYIYVFEDTTTHKVYSNITSKQHRVESTLEPLRAGDVVEFTCGVTDIVKTFRGEERTKIVRCSQFILRDHTDLGGDYAKTFLKREKQLDSKQPGDMIITMTYSNYKKFYSDCETLAGSFEPAYNGKAAIITVIIRAGRLKSSGTRGKQYCYYVFQEVGKDDAEQVTIKAMSEDNARKQLGHKYPNQTWELVRDFIPWKLH